MSKPSGCDTCMPRIRRSPPLISEQRRREMNERREREGPEAPASFRIWVILGAARPAEGDQISPFAGSDANVSIWQKLSSARGEAGSREPPRFLEVHDRSAALQSIVTAIIAFAPGPATARSGASEKADLVW